MRELSAVGADAGDLGWEPWRTSGGEVPPPAASVQAICQILLIFHKRKLA